MKRMQLFELEDLSWFPTRLRDAMTDYIVTFHKMVGTPRIIAPLIARVSKETGTNKIIDLCSGGGGPLLDILEILENDYAFSGTITMTDLHPNQAAAQRAEKASKNITYRLKPVDAGNVPDELDGLRTMICSFHHMPVDIASRILSNAFQKKRPIVIFELTNNSMPKLLWWVSLPIGFLLALLIMPFTFGFSLSRFLLTYIFPILPVAIAWDGAVSNARTYAKSDLEELTGKLVDPGYTWQMSTVSKTGYPSRFSYLLGIPGPTR